MTTPTLQAHDLTAFLERFDHYCDLKRQLRASPDGSEESRLLIGMLVDEWPRLEELRAHLAPIPEVDMPCRMEGER